ncbi:Crp/Fnr family transcriptional regulator [Sediminibacterium goheungense]|uniref:CRP-like cAMP-binding protein n=1 Tax=Sediminibacterium goheungense TaxID=1086393 RepID=A0A4V6PSI2_9BACT|nr:Crp/Fnr family transcriptional regulator [Sediminibacterium goheungense]TDO26328.1 CRP-like cAMP-binding protein [Sediminibacterium goheungense]
MPDLLLNHLKKHIQLTETEEHLILSSIQMRRFKRGDFLTKEGEVNRYTNFIVTGSAKVYYIDQQGQEHIIQLGIKEWWIGDFSSFITQTKGILYTEALTVTETASFSYDILQELYNKVPALERFFRLLTQKAYAAFHRRVLESLSMDAEQRYIAFRTSYPEMDQQLSQKDIAAYLGISAEFLSKIKKRIVEKQKTEYNR